MISTIQDHHEEWAFVSALIHRFDECEEVFEIADKLKASHFCNPVYGRIYEVILEMIRKREPITGVTVLDDLRERGLYEKGGQRADEVESVIQPPPDTYHPVHALSAMADIIIRQSQVGSAKNLAPDLNKITTTDEAQLIYNELGRILDDTTKQPFSVLQRDAIEVVERLITPEKQDGGGWLIKTGIFPLDRAILGLKSREVFVLGGRSGMGKSTLARCIALNIANDPEQDNWARS